MWNALLSQNSRSASTRGLGRTARLYIQARAQATVSVGVPGCTILGLSFGGRLNSHDSPHLEALIRIQWYVHVWMHKCSSWNVSHVCSSRNIKPLSQSSSQTQPTSDSRHPKRQADPSSVPPLRR